MVISAAGFKNITHLEYVSTALTLAAFLKKDLNNA